MDTIEKFYTWEGLIFLSILLIAIYWLLKLLTYLLDNLGKRNETSKHTRSWLRWLSLVYTPMAIILLLLNFISINYITHSLLLVAVGIFGYKHFKNYINGIFLKTNPLMSKGTFLQTKNFEGEIKKMLPLGLILNSESGEHFLNYSVIEENGFSVKDSMSSNLRHSIYLESEITEDQILDILFDNPILSVAESPSIKATNKSNEYVLKYTLETGANTNQLIAFLKQQNILTRQTNNTKI